MKILKNYMEILVLQVIDEVLGNSNEEICKCDDCRLDIAAMALNNLPPRYFASEKGEIFSKLSLSHLTAKTEVLTQVTKAIMHIANKPRHRIDKSVGGA
jgi:competence protein ComFB